MIEYLYLGRIGYAEALALQEEVVNLRQRGLVDNVLLLLEHPPVLTLGRNAHRSNILASDEFLASRGVTVHEINRGGDVTYHGPGQLVGYPIFDLRSLHNDSGSRLGPVDFVRRVEEALIRLCGQHGLPTFRIPGLTGVWCAGPAGGTAAQGNPLDESNTTASGADSCAEHSKDNPQGEKKIAAIGIHVSRGVTSHGFAFNLTTQLDDFKLIIPCGIADHPVASLEQEIAGPVPALEDFAHQAARQFGKVFGEQVLAIENMDVLRQQARIAEARAKFPAEDTAATPPEPLERLRQPGGGPVSA
ncbi:lipoyl(octanoyl) transferase LipB [Telmatobacter bradus]|uniref:lipoyl(octanoyl) transferase LipB n=1 Tax=Telmatobacter bradus TaxID=474953 RepID=UPI003B428137